MGASIPQRGDVWGMPGGAASPEPLRHGACIMGRLHRVFALTAPTNLRLHPKTIMEGVMGGVGMGSWSRQPGEKLLEIRSDAHGQGWVQGVGFAWMAQLQPPVAPQNHPRGASSGMLEQRTSAAAFSCSRSRGAMPAGRDGRGGRFAWMPRLQPSGRRYSSGKGCAGTGRVAPGRELNE